MKWFKHMTDSQDDEKLSDLIAEGGLEAYGFWWRLLEIVASQMGKDGEKCSATYSMARWSQLLYCHHHTVGKYIGKLQVRGMVRGEVELGKGYSKLTVTIPNLLKYRDEYSKKSGQAQKSVIPKKEKENTEGDKDLKPSSSVDEVVAAPEFYLTKKKVKLTGQRLISFNQFWEAFGYAKGKAEAADTWLAITPLTNAILAKIVAAAKVVAQQRFALKEAGKTPQMAQGWLSGRRWEDEEFTTPAAAVGQAVPDHIKATYERMKAAGEIA